MRLNPTLMCILIVACLTASSRAQAASGTDITQDEIKQKINEYSDCDSLDQIVIDHLEYFDFNGDGKNEAVVVASTCMTGTAGPDIHSVYMRASDGHVSEIRTDDILQGIRSLTGGSSSTLFGNRNSELAVEDGKLVERFRDTSDREDPVVVWYKWVGGMIVLDRMTVAGPFATSYDCNKAASEMDRAICYSPSIAALDDQLGKAYRDRMRQLPPDKKQSLQREQKDWLAARDKRCTIYKWWVDCLTDMYTKRIAELKQTSGIKTEPFVPQ